MKLIQLFKSLWFKIFFTLILFSMLIMGFQKKMGQDENLLASVKHNFDHLDFQVLGLSFLVFFAASLIGTYRFYVLSCSHNVGIPFKDLLKNVYIGYFFNSFLMGATGGDVVRSYYLTRLTGKKTEIVTIVFIDRFIGIVVLAFLACVALIFSENNPRLTLVKEAILALFFTLMFIALAVSSRRIMTRFAFIKRFLPSHTLNEIMKKIFLILNETKKLGRTLIYLAAMTICFQSLTIISCYLGAKSLSLVDPVPLKHFFLFLPVIFTISSIPVSLGGLGVGEGAYVALFLLVGVSESDSLSIALVNRVILLLAAFLGGFAYLSFKQHSKERVEIP